MKNEKILANEKISEEALDKVVGGYEGGGDDKKFLNALFGGKMDLSNDDLLREAWGKAGVTLKIIEEQQHGFDLGAIFGLSNGMATFSVPKYFVDGHEVTQSQARKHAMKTTGKILDITDWQ